MATIDNRTAPAGVRDFLLSAANEVNAELDRRLAIDPGLESDDPERRLREAMRYAVLGGGKRLRPAMVLAAARAVDPEVSKPAALAAAASVEILHAYTLVHDDLPAMDDDDVRRGRPTVHIQFDEATAVLAGDALLTVALACLSDLGPSCAVALRALTDAAGAGELLGGQMRDLALEALERPVTMAEAERVHRGKTGALFGVSAELGGISANAPVEIVRGLRDYGLAVGVAFQHADDLDDGEFSELREQAAARRLELATRAVDAVAPLGKKATLLCEIARWVGGA